MAFLDLPNEIWHSICLYLDTADDLCNFRLAKNTFASVGLQYLVPKVTLLRTPKALERLTAISSHPVLRYHVKEVIYCVDTIYDHQDKERFQSYMIMFHEKFKPPGEPLLYDLSSHLESNPRIANELDKLYKETMILREGFLNYPYDQESRILQEAFSNLSQLKSLRIESDTHNKRHPKQRRWPYSTFVFLDVNILMDGCMTSASALHLPLHLENIFNAVTRSNTRLKSLGLYNLPLPLLLGYLPISKGESRPNWLASVRDLTFTTDPHATDDENHPENVAGDVNQVLKVFPGLNDLWLSISGFEGPSLFYVPFSLLFRGISVSSLRVLRLESVCCDPKALLSLLQANSVTLRDLTIINVDLECPCVRGWIDILENISLVLALHVASFSGRLTGDDTGEIFDFDGSPCRYIYCGDKIEVQEGVLSVGQVLDFLLCGKATSFGGAITSKMREEVFDDLQRQSWLRPAGPSNPDPLVVRMRHAEAFVDLTSSWENTHSTPAVPSLRLLHDELSTNY